MTMLSAKIKNKNCQNIKRLPNFFYIWKVKCISNFLFIYFFMQKLYWNNILSQYMHTCYKIYGYFKVQLFTYHLSSVMLNVTLRNIIVMYYGIFRFSSGHISEYHINIVFFYLFSFCSFTFYNVTISKTKV